MSGPAENAEPEHQRRTPPLPRRLLALGPVVYVGTGGWVVAAVALLVARYGFDRTPPIWLWTALSGVALGIVGAGIMLWQQRASERGSRTAQKVD
ncbi:DUF2530 domain-containing protein [Actinokineospora bangkokensis]|uniref:DUF2530 domain-containing protein n=1 Tax=Actinokineospora bangkokensis TaxID=1193682 RepID=A0A1Q9LCZ6_9PSEU|nr:DUF2530 domain-containing protein [Actinokineospora bangkokensis]OLR89875.1 hypothetical protein BJP25_02380 [Actinokineospora bangkokensis]